MTRRKGAGHGEAARLRVTGMKNTVVQIVGAPAWLGNGLAPASDPHGARARTLGFDPQSDIAISTEMVGRSRRASQLALAWLQSVINVDHGFPSDDAGSPSCAWATAGIAWVGAGATTPPPNWCGHTLQWLWANANNDDGIPLTVKGTDSIVDATAMAAMALMSVGAERCTSQLRVRAGYLRNAQARDGSWSWTPRAHTGSTISSSFAVLALARALRHEPVAADWPVVERGLQWLRHQQNVDGGLPLVSGGPSTAASSGIVLLLFSALGLSDRAPLREYLLSTIVGSSWPDSIERPHGHTVIRAGLPYALAGLAADGHVESSPAVEAGLSQLLDEAPSGYRSLAGAPGTRTWPTRDLLLALSLVQTTPKG